MSCGCQITRPSQRYSFSKTLLILSLPRNVFRPVTSQVAQGSTLEEALEDVPEVLGAGQGLSFFKARGPASLLN